MNYTSVEQSEKLLDIGLNPYSADLKYKCIGFTMHTTRPTDDFKYKVLPKEQDIPHESKYDVPCWSVGALIELMPFAIYKDGKENKLEIRKDDAGYYVSSYWHYNDCGFYLPEHSVWDKILVDACYNMICWLLENDYIKKSE